MPRLHRRAAFSGAWATPKSRRPFISGEARARGAVMLRAFLDVRGMAGEGCIHDGISRLRSDVQALGSLRS